MLFGLIVLISTLYLAGDAAPVRGRFSASDKGRWEAISDPVTSQLKCDWPGLTAGVVVDRTSGDVYMVVCGQGIWKSTDQGRSFARTDGSAVGGRCETGFALCADAAGRRLCCFMLDGLSG